MLLQQLLDKEISIEMITLTENEYIIIILMHLIQNQACSVRSLCFHVIHTLNICFRHASRLPELYKSMEVRQRSSHLPASRS